MMFRMAVNSNMFYARYKNLGLTDALLCVIVLK